MEFNSYRPSNKTETKPSQESLLLSHVDQLKQILGEENFPDNEEILITERAAKKVIENILLENNGKLPEFIVYPETSARVLPYLFNPSFRKIAEKTGTRPPMSYFISIFGTYNDEKFPERTLVEAERAQEIVENAKLHGFNTESICVIDDTLINGSTNWSIKNSFPDKNISMHYLLGFHSPVFDKKGRRDVGYSFSDNERPRPGKAVAPFWRLPNENKLKQVGVVKNREDKYVEAYPGSTHKDKKYLRDILSAIGEDIFLKMEEEGKARKETKDFLDSYYAESN